MLKSKKCVLCEENAVTTVAQILVCERHNKEYKEEAAKYLPDDQRIFYRKLVVANELSKEKMKRFNIGRMSIKNYATLMNFISAVKRGKQSLMIGLEYVCMNRKMYDEYLENYEILEIINKLRENEGASLILFCDNPDFSADAVNNAVEVIDSWTNWKIERFEGNTFSEALKKALKNKIERE